MKYVLGFIGGGNIAEAIVRAAVSGEVLLPDRICVSDPSPQRVALFQSLGVDACDDNRRVIASASNVVLAIKPQMLGTISIDLQQVDSDRQVLISIMAGIRCQKIEEIVGRTLRIVRVMPNTPLLVGQGMSAVAMGPHAQPGDDDLTMKFLGAAGEVIRVHESELDAVTAVSGSGPAYAFYLAEAMVAAAKSLGLSDDHAAMLTKQTILGAAKLMKDSTDTPQELRRKVTSPGGTTQAAIEHLESQSVGKHIIEAITKAASRSKELGR